MRKSFSQCAGVIVLAIMASGCYSGGKWTMPWQSSSPFSSSSTPSTSNVTGVTKPSTLANNAPPSSVTAPPASYPSYPGTAAGMNNNNNFAPAYQATNPPAGSTAAAYTANSNNAAGRSGALVVPQQGAYPANNTIPSSANPAAGSYGAPSTATAPYSATTPSNAFNGTTPGYGNPPSGNYGVPSSGSGAAQPALPYGGAAAGVQPNASNYPRGAANANAIPTSPTIPPTGPLTGNYDAGGWSSSSGNPARPTNQPVAGDRYAGANDRYGNNSGGDRYDTAGATSPATSSDSRYGVIPTASTPDARYAPPTDARYGSSFGAGAAAPATTPAGTPAPTSNSGSGVSLPSAGTTGGAAGSSAAYQPGSVSSYEPANKPAVITADNPASPTVR